MTEDHELASDVTGALGEAHRVDPERLRASLTGAQVATLDYWWIKVPGQAMIVAHVGEDPADVESIKQLEVWATPEPLDTFALGVITLADLPGVPPARRTFPWVTHELMVYTLDTTKGPVAFESPLPWRYMEPHNVSVQFEVHSDEQARHLAHDIVWAVCSGMLPPEIQAYVPERKAMRTLAPLWDLWKEVVTNTAEHIRTDGTHVE